MQTKCQWSTQYWPSQYTTVYYNTAQYDVLSSVIIAGKYVSNSLDTSLFYSVYGI